MYQNLIYISRYLDFYYQILNPYLLPNPHPYLPLTTSTPIYPYLPLNNFLQGQWAQVPWTYFFSFLGKNLMSTIEQLFAVHCIVSQRCQLIPFCGSSWFGCSARTWNQLPSHTICMWIYTVSLFLFHYLLIFFLSICGPFNDIWWNGFKILAHGLKLFLSSFQSMY